ncbi:5-methyltetrahydropteroyltriglutamate--homocysteine S-methyltransferase [Aquimarina spongiae]|uniref:5-methyltetrahydropteroyltriglutamate--homocysteine methyltransferase n=1 Tax=Aquimarina spongiae TaxID=570521 RepID=A0A1M6G600_9FLAO|nr:5-methyltetrahydropteroyltriglutamate--homocysteine S-methyltransferase [Aquimarina spongiae]SHJ05349.1 methionine synthase (B12-independent) [Aquimarina spongiae]
MLTHNLGYPRIGSKRELKKALEQYWAGKTTQKNLFQVGKKIRQDNWLLQKEANIDLIPSNDFSFYDQVLDMTLLVGAIPERYQELITEEIPITDLYFAMARGYQKGIFDLTAMEMTKWFDTNYHYIVPEFYRDQEFKLFSTKIIDEFYEAKQLGIITKPVLIGPISYLLLGKEKESGFHRIELIKNLLPVYKKIIKQVVGLGAVCIQFDEPFLGLDISPEIKAVYKEVYHEMKAEFPDIKFMITTYFEGVAHHLDVIVNDLQCDILHIDLISNPEQLEVVLEKLPKNIQLSLGVIDGRNIWKNDYHQSLQAISTAIDLRGEDQILIAPSCSLLHVPCDLDLEMKNEELSSEIKQWLSFAKQKLDELSALKQITLYPEDQNAKVSLKYNAACIENRSISELIHNPTVKERVSKLSKKDSSRGSEFPNRKRKQKALLNLPLFPTTTIGSFPQTKEIRKKRSEYKGEIISQSEYTNYIKDEIKKVITIQEKLGLDVLVHGEAERNDMVEYFGEQLNGFAFTKFGWVQSYGSRCVKPPIIYGDVSRKQAMTVFWSTYAQSLTPLPVKGMLTGPVTMLQWSFVRDDQSLSKTCLEIAMAIRDEVQDLEQSGIKIIQIDEPAMREGLPLLKENWSQYLDWAINAFKIASCVVKDQTQIHTHMCYSEFNDIIDHIALMDADVITIECSRSQMELLDVFASFKYPNDIGPGVYDIHSPRIPSPEEIVVLLNKAKQYIPEDQIWVNPDCGLKTRNWQETEKALDAMVAAAKQLRTELLQMV